MATAQGALPTVTFIVEWENAIDVEDEWTAKAMTALEREMRDVAPRMTGKPVVMYLYDKNEVPAGTVDKVIDATAPGLRDVADVEVIETDGLTYYKLKNYGIARSRTDLAVMIDSDAAPQPGWLDALLAPFADPEVMVVGGFTRLGHEDFLSRAMALSWIFNLDDEGEKAAKRNTIHVNNCAVRTEFFRQHPFPDLQAFKKQCVFWLKAVQREGFRYVRVAGAKAIHAPHPGIGFLAWRAWTGGLDSDFVAYHRRTRNPVGRFLYSFIHFGKRFGRAAYRILFRAKAVGMPVWERPAALFVALAYHGTVMIAQMVSSVTRRFEPLPPFQPIEAIAG